MRAKNKKPGLSLALMLPLLLALIGVGAATLGSSAAHAEESWGYDLGHELMSPYCPGRTLATCPSPQAAELVQWIVTQEAAGASQEQVLEMLVDRFGEDILGAPPAEGFTLWAYILPVAAFVIGGGLVLLVLSRVVKAGAAQPDTQPLFQTPSAPLSPSLSPSLSPPLAGAGDDAHPHPPQRPPSPPDATGLDSDEELARLVDSDLQRRA